MTKSKLPIVVLLRNELRLRDNPLLAHAASSGSPVVPLYVWQSEQSNCWGLGQTAAAVWLEQSLKCLDASLQEQYNNPLIVRHVHPDKHCTLAQCVISFMQEIGATDVVIGERYDGKSKSSDENLAKLAHSVGLNVTTLVTSALHDPSKISLSSGQKGYFHWGTLMPFLRACEKHGPVPRPLPKPASLPPYSKHIASEPISFVCMPCRNGQVVDWGEKIRRSWPNIGEDHAHAALEAFISCLTAGLMSYEKKRSRADINTSTARISPHLRFGEISPRSVYWAIKDRMLDRSITKTFLRRFYWRDLAYFHHLAFPNMCDVGIRRHYDQTEWTSVSSDKGHKLFHAWKSGKTGYPMVDAGMRELHETGWMNQSVRMVVASFLCEILNIDWRYGAKHFHQELVDADVSINAMMWQNAGRSGIDQWNFFMSPENASQDPSGSYTKRWVPELSNLPLKYLHKPWTAPALCLRRLESFSGITIRFVCVWISMLQDGKPLTVSSQCVGVIFNLMTMAVTISLC